MTSHVPQLKYRVPNPPAAFLGRGDELEQLGAALERAPIAVLVGAGGMGKSGLVRAFVAQSGAPAVHVAVHPDEGVAHVIGEICRALSGGPVDHGVDLDAAMDMALAAADQHGASVVIEDVHNLVGDDAWALINTVGDFARSSRWLVTSREEPIAARRPEQIVRLGPLDDSHCLALAAMCVPDADQATLDAVVAQASGCPLEVRRVAIAVREKGRATSRILENLPVAGRPLVETLAHTTLPLTLEDLREAVTIPMPSIIDALVAGGVLAIEGGERVRLQEKLRDAVAQELAPERSASIRVALSDALGEVSDPDALMEALRAALRSRDLSRARDLVARRFSTLTADGRAQRLWRLLRPCVVELPATTMRAALAAKTSESLRWAAAQTSPARKELALRLEWVQARHVVRVGRQGLFQDALELAEDARSVGDQAMAFAAVLHAAEVAFVAGRLDEATQALDDIGEAEGGLTLMVRRDAMRARIAEMAGDREQARIWALAAAAKAEGLPVEARAAALRRAHLVAASTDHGQPKAPMPADGGFWSVFLWGLKAGLDGRGADVARARDVLDPSTFNNPTEHVMHQLLGMLDGIVNGPTDAVYNNAQAAFRRAQASGDWLGLQWAIVAYHLATWLCLRRPPRPVWPEGMMPPAAPLRELIEFLDELHRVDVGGADDKRRAAAPDTRHSESGPLAVGPALGHALLSILHGRLNDAVLWSARALRVVSAQGVRFVEFAVRSVQLIALVAGGREAALQRALNQCSDLVERMNSPAASAGLLFMEAVFASHLKMAELESLAAQPDNSAIWAHWARHILRGDVPDGRSHQVVVGAVRQRWADCKIRRFGDDPWSWRRGWGVDESTRTVWRVDGRIQSLGRNTVSHKLLNVLIAREGVATKEQLVEGVWATEYHPLRDDPKLQVSMARLRKLMGDDVPGVAHLVTTEDGYAVNPEVPFTVISRDAGDRPRG